MYKLLKCFFLLALMLLSLSACKSGLDVASFGLNSKHVIDYGQLIKKGNLREEVRAYAGIYQRSTIDPVSLFDGEVEDIDLLIEQMHGLPARISVTKAEADDLKVNVDSFEVQLMKDIKDLLGDASKNASGAKALHDVVFDYIKNTGSYDIKAQTLKNNSSASFTAALDKITDDVKDGLGVLYGKAVLVAQAQTQRDINKDILELENFLKDLEAKLATFTSLANKLQAQVEIDKAQDLLEIVKRNADLMTDVQRKVKDILLNNAAGLLGAVQSLKANYVDLLTDVAEQTIAQALYNDANNAATDISRKANNYPSIEDIKFPAEDFLKALIEKVAGGFDGVASDPLSLKVGNDLDTLNKIFTSNENSVVHMLANHQDARALIEALAAMIVFGKSATKIDNLYLLDGDELNKTIKLYGFTPADTDKFVQSQAQKLHKTASDNGKRNSIYVIFADQFDHVNIANLAQKLANPGGVIIVSSRTPTEVLGAENLSSIKFFKPNGLSAVEMANVAIAKARELNKQRSKQGKSPLNTWKVAEIAAKVMRAFVPEQSSIDNISSLVEKSFAALSEKKAPSNNQIEEAVLLQINGNYPKVSLPMVTSSKVISHSFTRVDKNVKKNLGYYSQMLGGAHDPAIMQRVIDENRRLTNQVNNVLTTLQNMTNDSNNRNEDTRRRDELKTQAHNQKELFKAAVESLRAVAHDKRDKAIIKWGTTEAALAVLSYKAETAINETIATASRCYSDDNAVALISFFPEIDRKTLFNTIFDFNPANNDEVRDGKLTTDKYSDVNCYIYGRAPRDLVLTELNTMKTELKLGFKKLIDGMRDCFDADQPTFGDWQTCNRGVINDFERVRKGFALNKIADLTRNIPFLYDYTDSRNLFVMKDDNTTDLTSSVLAGSFGEDLILGFLDSDKRLAANIKNRLFYWHKLLKEIAGSDYGSVFMSLADQTNPAANIQYTIADINNLGHSDNEKFKYIRPLFASANYRENVEENSIMAQALTEVFKNYQYLLVHKFVKILYENVVTSLKDKVVDKFWNLPEDTLIKFHNTVLPLEPIEDDRNDIWNEMTKLSALVNNLASALKNDFVVDLSDGGENYNSKNPVTQVVIQNPISEHFININTQKLRLVGDAFESVLNKGEQINALLWNAGHALGAAGGTDSPTIDGLGITYLKEALEALLLRINIGSNIPWVDLLDEPGVPGYAAPAYSGNLVGADGDSILEAYQAAYELHVFYKSVLFHEANFTGAGYAFKPIREYRLWHPKHGAGPVKHPIAP